VATSARRVGVRMLSGSAVAVALRLTGTDG
jgi:hypothetical protein